LLTTHSPGWFAEIDADFTISGESIQIFLYLHLERENGGWKWVVSNIYSDYHRNILFGQNQSIVVKNRDKFIHPMSHELEFMNLYKFLKADKELSNYTSSQFSADYLSIFLYDLKTSELKFDKINYVRFHVYQIKGWYFEIENIERKGKNAGWLITNLLKIPENDKKMIIKSLYYGAKK